MVAYIFQNGIFGSKGLHQSHLVLGESTGFVRADTVSYTHLDVYKRQVRGQSTKNNARTRKGRKKTVANKKKATK